jgi:hypothetical protein
MSNIQEKMVDPTPREGTCHWKGSDVDGAWTAMTDKDNHVGVGKVTIVDDSPLIFEYIRTVSGEVYDTITLKRDHEQYARKFQKKLLATILVAYFFV